MNLWIGQVIKVEKSNPISILRNTFLIVFISWTTINILWSLFGGFFYLIFFGNKFILDMSYSSSYFFDVGGFLSGAWRLSLFIAVMRTIYIMIENFFRSSDE